MLGTPYGIGLNINSGANAVLFSGNAYVRALTLTSGNINFGNSIVNVSSSLAKLGGTLSMGTSTFRFECQNSQIGCWGTSVSMNPGNMVFNDVFLLGGATAYNFGGTTMTVSGNLTVGDIYASAGYDYINSGTISVSGNLNIVNNGTSGTGIIKLAGSTNQTITSASAVPIPNLTIASTGGTVSLAGLVKINSATVVTTGTTSLLNSSASLTTTTLSLNGTTLAKSGGIVTVGGNVISTGALYGGTVNP